ncbi:hypothetical protein D3C71_1403880 [compost metagenome]
MAVNPTLLMVIRGTSEAGEINQPDLFPVPLLGERDHPIRCTEGTMEEDDRVASARLFQGRQGSAPMPYIAVWHGGIVRMGDPEIQIRYRVRQNRGVHGGSKPIATTNSRDRIWRVILVYNER